MDPDDASNSREPDYQFYVKYDFYGKDNPSFHRKNLYGFHQGKIRIIIIIRLVQKIRCVYWIKSKMKPSSLEALIISISKLNSSRNSTSWNLIIDKIP